MDSADQVVFVLQLILALGPLALYFLALGLVNSQSHPCLINARVDFVLLAVAFLPVMIGPMLLLIEHGHALIAAGVVAGMAALFRALLPARRGAWVIYNVSREQCRVLMERACRRLNWSVTVADDQIRVSPVHLVITQSALPWLRNVALRIRCLGGVGGEDAQEQLIDALASEIQRESMLPSPMGASLVVIGAALLGMPMWYLFHHMDAIVDVVRQILFA